MTITPQDLIDRAAITDALIAYAQAQDQNDWALFDEVFTPDATIEIAGVGLPPFTPESLRAMLTAFNETRISGQHLVANTLFDITGDTARTLSEALYITLHPTDREGILRRQRGNALYRDDWRRVEGQWRISRRVIAQKNVEEDEGSYAPDLLAAIRLTSATDWWEPRA